ncbi:hypothetical protein [Variovorax sp. YR216]|uniref:hypothetical protein n=1 Tax=Variovorax sp. YR216 TaxID=1882828 RepID=UPI0008967980|nr:hypothetical protein [Variovorax sp. YR216]SEB26216.1 hypothetical protein SAMN05444680_13022 [Variovorax sp. YR216]
MKSPFAVFWGVSLALLCAAAPAAELELQGSRLLVSGMLDGTAIKAFEEQLASGHIRTVVFENSLGGTPEVASEFAQAIRANGVNTEVKGQCHAACAYAFLAGKEHRFGRGFQVNGLLIPVAGRPRPADLVSRWNGDDGVRTLSDFIAPPAEVAPTDTAAAATPAQASAAVTVQAAAPKERWQANQGVLFVSTPTLFGRVYNSFYCDGTQGRDMSRCELLSDADPYKLGVLTP